jgi:hypothetical protein
LKTPLKRLNSLAAIKGQSGPIKIRKPLAAFEEEEPRDIFEDLQQIGDVTEDSTGELTAIQAEFRRAREHEISRYKQISDASFYCVMVFDSGSQCEAFLRGSGLNADHAKSLFIDGRKVADHFGIELPEVKLQMPKFKLDKKLSAMAGIPKK